MALIEDCESMLMLKTPKLANIPTIKVASLIANKPHKSLKKGLSLALGHGMKKI